MVKGKMEETTGWRGQNECQIEAEEKRNGRFVGAAETSKELAEWRRLQRNNLNMLCLLKSKDWSQCHRKSSWQERRSHLCQKEKEQSRQSRVPHHVGGRESRWVRAALWRERGRSEQEHKEERVDSTVIEDRFQRGKGGHAKRASLIDVEGGISG